MAGHGRWMPRAVSQPNLCSKLISWGTLDDGRMRPFGVPRFRSSVSCPSGL